MKGRDGQGPQVALSMWDHVCFKCMLFQIHLVPRVRGFFFIPSKKGPIQTALWASDVPEASSDCDQTPIHSFEGFRKSLPGKSSEALGATALGPRGLRSSWMRGAFNMAPTEPLG